MVSKTLFSSNSAEWETPQELFDQLNKEFGFTMDVCATFENRKCEVWLGHGPGSTFVDGLKHSWGSMVCWMNPPYGRDIGLWIAKASEEAQKGATVVCLLPARTDTKYVHDYIWDTETHRTRQGVELRLLKGRLKFGGSKNSAPFPSMVVVFRGE